MTEKEPRRVLDRRDFLRTSTLVTLGGLAGALGARSVPGGTVWQIDPDLCVRCGRCATHCVLGPSAVKCVHSFDVCGYCALCGGYHRPDATAQDTAAENQLCPTGAIRRRFVEEPFYEYTVDEERCIGCGKCVAGCAAFGNGSLYLQVRHDRCLGCNDCSVARACPSGAMQRMEASRAYVLRGRQGML